MALMTDAPLTPPAILVADIGGTNSRFALVAGGELTARLSVSNDEAGSLEAAVDRFLAVQKARPSHAVLAVAAPVGARAVRLTNRDWIIDAEALERRFGFARVDLLNDFAAVAHGLPRLGADQLHMIGPAETAAATKVVLGPGTGLGVAALIESNGVWRALPSEGGHIELAATTAREAEVFALLRRRLGRVSAEFVVSGMGLAHLDAAFAETDGTPYVPRDGAEVERAARAGEARALDVMTLFADALARFAGDMAVTFVARGGVYIAGGIVPKIVDRLDPGRFREAFEAKAPHQALMAGIATGVILEQDPGLFGCLAYAAQKYK